MTHSHDPSSRTDDVWEEVLTDEAVEDDQPGQHGALWASEQAGLRGPDADASSGDASPDGEPSSGRRRRGRRLRAVANRRAATGLAAVMLLAIGFTGGVLVQRQQDDGGGAQARAFPGGGQLPTGGLPAGMQPPGGASGAAGGASGSGAAGGPPGGFAPGGGNATVGEVANVRGSTIYVKQSDGTTVRVVAATGATVSRTVSASMTGVHPGDTVIVSGETDDDGTVKATSVRATASEASGR